jgi:hypothetical protein
MRPSGRDSTGTYELELAVTVSSLGQPEKIYRQKVARSLSMNSQSILIVTLDGKEIFLLDMEQVESQLST